jgi:hypothetical protein
LIGYYGLVALYDLAGNSLTNKMNRLNALILGFLIVTAALFSLCAGNKDTPQETGGVCSYKEVNGRCTILSLEGDNPLSPVAVKHTFTPIDDVDLILGEENDLKNSLTNSGRVYTESSKDLGLACLKDVGTPKKEDLENKCNIKENKIISCTASVLDSGTCTPIILRFNGL